MQQLCKTKHHWRRLCWQCHSFGTTSLGLASRSQTHYDILNIKKNATQAEVKAAFVKLSKEVHPDKNPNDPTTHDKFVEVNEAYMILNNPATRRNYDQSLQLPHYHSYHSPRPTPTTTAYKQQSYEYKSEGHGYWGDDYIYYMRARSGQHDYGAQGPKDSGPPPAVGSAVRDSVIIIALGAALFMYAFNSSVKRSQHALARNKAYIAQIHKQRTDARARQPELKLEQLQASLEYLDRKKISDISSHEKKVGAAPHT